MRHIATILLITILALVLVGCSSDKNPISSLTGSDEGAKDFDRSTDGPNSTITYEITLTDVVYDPINDHTTFTYEVLSNPGGGPAISHWVIGFDEGCGSSDIIVSSNDSAVEWNESDPTTGVRGIKFDTGYNDEELREVTLTLAGNWNFDEILIAVKSGNGFVTGSAIGPVCGGGGDDDDTTYNISGSVFFDIDGDGIQDADEPGIPNVEVTLSDGSVITTDENGYYIFEELDPGDYTVVFTTPDGTTSTTPVSIDDTIVDEDLVINAGFNLDFESFCGRVADGYTIGFWKNNLSKAIKGRTRGVQVDAQTLDGYVSLLSNFALYPLNISSKQDAYDILNAKGSDAVLLLSKQLMGSEFNYANGAYINGNETLTWMFVYWGEYLINNSGNYSRDELLYAKDWFDAYNNSHGGEFYGPGCVE